MKTNKMLNIFFANGVVVVLVALIAGCQSLPKNNKLMNDDPIAGAMCGAFGGDITTKANAVEPKSGREFYLEYPCDLKADEKVTLVLNLHGGGSAGAWQRLYFPVTDYATQYRLVVATPTAVVVKPFRLWTAEADDQYLEDLTELLISKFGKDNIQSFWFAGHSQGGLTTTRIICSDYFASRADGFLSLAGGRVGMRLGGNPSCDYSHIAETGSLDSMGTAGIPDTSPLADRFSCDEKKRQPDIVDTVAGKVYDTRSEETGRPPREGWGGKPGPGTAQVYTFPNCANGELVADVIRLDKGHTEGLEPKITEKLVEMMVSIPGGKIRSL
ncbi:MAG: hypothetical protein K6L75_08795 [Cellvibrionaceae bacterium]